MFTPNKTQPLAATKNLNEGYSDPARNAADEAKAELRVAANNAGRTVREFIDNASDEFDQAKNKVTRQINAKPVQAAAIALGIGVVLGALLRR